MDDYSEYVENAVILMGESINAIDARFGDGTAETQPALLGAFMITVMLDIQNHRAASTRK
jgi:hypothetical protein